MGKFLQPSTRGTDLHDTAYEGAGASIELSEVPRSRASSFNSRQSLFVADNDQAPLINESLNGCPDFHRNATARRNVTQLDGPPTSTSANREKKRRLQGWRFGVAACACLTFLVLMTNSLFVTIASVKYAVVGGIGTLFEGNCHYVEETSVWLHVGINVLSSLLLSASNYTMQALCSPTRAEVDKAHAAGDWVDIGTPSFRNIWGRISIRRTAMWWILGLSSVPIHLLYNSAVFKTIDANFYQVVVVNSRFFDRHLFEANVTAVGIDFGNWNHENFHQLRNIQGWFIENRDTAHVQKLTNLDCMSAYGTSFVSGYKNVLLITDDQGKKDNQSVLWASNDLISIGGIQYNWLCQDMPGFDRPNPPTCDVATAKKGADTWTVRSKPIEYCLTQLLPSHCKLQFSQVILITVIVMNFAKFAIMTWTYYFQKSVTLVTVGDAIASFLDAPDPATRSRCLTSKADVALGPLQWRRGENGTDRPNETPLPQVFHNTSRAWFHAASRQRWSVTRILLLLALIAIAYFLALGVNTSLLKTSDKPFSMGFGKIDPRFIIGSSLPVSGASGLLAAVLLANTPQAICSLLYLAYNGLFTCMLLCDEWSRYFLQSKPLRVTSPRGQQRSKYYLQLPFAYSVPLLAASTLLHWLISESIFLARIDYYDNSVSYTFYSASQTGYSPLPMLLVLLLGLALLAIIIGQGFRKFSSPMPVVGSCSVAIASACHRPKDDEDAAYLPVSWGEINHEGTEEVGHCAFTSQQVYEPVNGRMYAGSCPNHEYAWKRRVLG